jgi:hypothetical protein
MTVDKNSFTEPQWEAIALYVEARRRQRQFYRTAILAALIVCFGAFLARSIIDGGAEPFAGFHWLQTAALVFLLIVFSVGAGLFHWAVVTCRTGLLQSGVWSELISEFEKYPSRKF